MCPSRYFLSLALTLRQVGFQSFIAGTGYASERGRSRNNREESARLSGGANGWPLTALPVRQRWHGQASLALSPGHFFMRNTPAIKFMKVFGRDLQGKHENAIS
jgi:hypothetical protein